MDITAFLQTVITTSDGYFNLATRQPNGEDWAQEWFTWPEDLDKIVERAEQAKAEGDVYFSSHLFEIKNASKENVLPTRTIQADLDNAVVPVENVPNILVETSPNRHQGFWILQDNLDPEELESLSKQLTYSIPNADRSGWSLGHKMRLPGTFNYKYNTGTKSVRVISAILDQINTLKLPKATLLLEEQTFVEDWTPKPLEGIGPREFWLQNKQSLPRRVQSQYEARQPDRSGALWLLELSCFRAGLNRDQVFWLAKNSANNKFAENRYHGDLDLAKDVLNAERALKRGDIGSNEDVRAKIADARKLPGTVAERRAYISAVVRDELSKQGSFVATSDGQEWYVREDTGRPIVLSRSNDYFNSLLDIRFGLNSIESEQKYTIAGLMSSTKEHGKKGHVASLSFYDPAQQSVLLHTGRKHVLKIDKSNISVVSNGQLGIIFPWRSNEDSYDPDYENPVSLDTVFESCFDNLNEMPREQALALIKAWFYFLFFRDDATGRPILALFGQPGSGKSTLFRRIYTLLYGPSKAVNSVTTAEDFDHAVANDPLVVFDNIDTYVSWLPDKLALSASTSDLVRRKLYTDSDTVTLKRQALVGLTAHNPKFRREDIVDRLIIISLHRLEKFAPETEILNKITKNRDQLWGGIVKDIQKILATPQPLDAELPRYRVSDFARIGLWIAQALGFDQDFIKALNSNIREQTSYNLEEEDILIDAIKTWVTLDKNHDPNKYYAASQLWTAWQIHSRDSQNFSKLYKNAVILGKKIWTLQEVLNTILEVDFEFDGAGARLWRIRSR